MLKNTGVLLIGLLFMTAVHNIQAADKHLQCWHCSSDTIGSEGFCDIDFKENNIPNDLLKERNINVIRSCNSIINSEHQRAVCRKTVEDTNGKTVTKRFCYYTNKSDPIDYCNTEVTEKNVQRKFCQDCLTDKCNSAAQVTGIVILMVIPTIYSCILVL